MATGTSDRSTGRRPRPHALGSVAVAARAAALLTALLAGVVAAQADHAHPTTFEAHDYAFEGPSELTAGWQTVTLTNNGAEMHHLQFARLNDDVTPDEFFAALGAEGPEALTSRATMTGGVGMIPPGTSAEVLVDFTQPGTYVLLCFLPDEAGVPHLALGMTDVLQVVEAEADAAAEPEADYEVRMRDFAFDMPTSVPAGEHTWKVVNDGPQPHEMIVVKLNEGVTFEQFMATLEAEGEAAMPGVPIGGAQALSPNLANYLTYDLEPGDYAALCFVPDPETGLPHVALGMAAGFTVEEAQAGN